MSETMFESDEVGSVKRHSVPGMVDLPEIVPRLYTMPTSPNRPNRMTEQFSLDIEKTPSAESLGEVLTEAEDRYLDFSYETHSRSMTPVKGGIQSGQCTLKSKLQQFQTYIERSFKLLNAGKQDSTIEGYSTLAKVMTKAWKEPRIGHDLAYGLCDYFRDSGYLSHVVHFFIQPNLDDSIRFAIGSALVEFMSAENRDFIVRNQFLGPLVQTAKELIAKECGKAQCPIRRERLRISTSLSENLFKHSPEVTYILIDLGLLDLLLNTIKKANRGTEVVRHAALALTNLSMYSDSDCDQKITGKKVPNWLFLLASHQDQVTSYYACLAICVLSCKKEIQGVVYKSGTLRLVEPFLLTHKPTSFIHAHYKLAQGKQKGWLKKMLPLLESNRKEPKSLAAFHFCMEAIAKKSQGRLDVLHDIGAVRALKEVASSPYEMAAKFATKALEIIGEEIPYKLSQQVPLWSIMDVQYWVNKIGFEKYSKNFAENMVDGDLLLLLTEEELGRDLEMTSSLMRKRFMRELESLKISTDYSSVDETNLDGFLMSVCPELSIYTYRLLQQGVDRSLLFNLTEDILEKECGFQNSMHRLRLVQVLQDCMGKDDVDVAILSKQIDIFICYRRSSGNQLASLLKVQLQLRGYKVFLDVDRLQAGKFDSSLLKNIQAATHFILVLTENCLDRLLDTAPSGDWVHREIHCALRHCKNIIPVFDGKFEFPDECRIPEDIRSITRFNGIHWVHEYQEACVDKIERFLKGQVERTDFLHPTPLDNQESCKEDYCGETLSTKPLSGASKAVEVLNLKLDHHHHQQRSHHGTLTRFNSAPLLTTKHLTVFIPQLETVHSKSKGEEEDDDKEESD